MHTYCRSDTVQVRRSQRCTPQHRAFHAFLTLLRRSSALVVASFCSGASLMGELGNPGYVGGDAGAVEWLTPVC